MRKVASVLCCLVVGAIPALGQAAASSKSDQAFVDFAAQTDMVEANLGQLAQTNASAQGVKDFGQTLTTDHTKDYGQLGVAAQQAGLTVANSIDKMHNTSMIGPFQKPTGAAFDKKFIADMVSGHTAAIARYKKEAADGQNDAIKAYAQAALPTLQQHLDAAKALEKSGGK